MANESISDAAKKRLKKLQEDALKSSSSAVTKMPPPKGPSFRDAASSADLQQIKNRQEAEALDEGIKRGKKGVKRTL